MTNEQKNLVEAFAQNFYHKPHRHYHNWAHIENVVAVLRPVSDEQYLAAIFHDVVYDPASSTNEEDSAKLFEDFYQTGAHSLTGVNVERVKELILATKAHTFKQGDNEWNALVKADLSILYAAPFVFKQYEQGIAQEYSFVPRAYYLRERVRILGELKTFAVRHKVYFSAEELKQLRTNIDQLVKKLTQEADDLLRAESE